MEEDCLNDFGVDDGVAELNGTVESMEEPDTTPTFELSESSALCN